MKLLTKPINIILLLVFLAMSDLAYSQACTTLGQTPATAFPVCGTTVFHQSTVPLCSTNDILVPGCTGDGAAYQNKNPFFYKFTCYVSGTLGFLIKPLAPNEDYDWQLWDITGRNPNDIFTVSSIVVSGNWAGTYGNTGASATGVNYIQCASVPSDNKPTFAQMPNLIAGHEYLLMISHFTDGQSGYDLSFGGGTGVITDPNMPKQLAAKPDCDGTKVTVILNKKVKCSSLTASGSEFSLSPAVTTVISAVPDSCTMAFDFDEVLLTLASPVPNGTYDIVVNRGSDGNTLLDNCDNAIPDNNRVSFTYAAPVPIFADSIGKLGCAVDTVRVYFPKKIICSSIAPDGTDFSVSGPTPVSVIGAYGNCVNGKTPYITVKFSAPIYAGGTYLLTLKAGDDGTVVVDECGQETPVQTLPFNAADTVNADFQYNLLYGCLTDTVFFSHNGAHNVDHWTWVVNTRDTFRTQTVVRIFPATSVNNVMLMVSNGVCTDTLSKVVTLDNEVRASFTMDNIICPEDHLSVTNTSTGMIDAYRWNFDIIGTSTMKDPPPFLFPTLGREAYYTVKLMVYNFTLGCKDSARHTLTVLDHCFIDVPTAFTPNNDGLNDSFHPHNALKADSYQFKVFNRWGQVVFQSTNWQERWDGTIKGIKQAPGVYVWMLSYVNRDTKQPVFRKGTVMLIR
jgi:gliding motility-associated-like protein